MQITITAEGGQMTVEADGKEPYACESAAECIDYVEGLLAEVAMDEAPPTEAGEEPEVAEAEMDAEAMWNEEASKRPPQRNLMA